MNQLDLRNRHAIVTGGAAGIGFAIAQRMIASGASVTQWRGNGAGAWAVAPRRNTSTQSIRMMPPRPRRGNFM